MASRLHPDLEHLLDAGDSVSAERAWTNLLRHHSPTILRAIRRYASDYDQAMDGYAYVLEELKKDEFRRFRTYAADPRGKFRTWLLVVSRRLFFDHRRKRYGRDRGGSPATRENLETRRRLADLVAEDFDGEVYQNPQGTNPETDLRSIELSDALAAALKTIDPDDHLLLQLRYRDDLPVRRIGEVMHYPNVFHVYRRLKFVLEGLKKTLVASGIDGPDP